MNAVLSCNNIHKEFLDGSSTITVLNGINFDVAPGQLNAIVGASGSGKTTFLTILSGLAHPTSGEVWVNGRNFYSTSDAERSMLRNKALGYVYQFPHLLQEFTAIENVVMPLLLRGESFSSASKKAEKTLRRLGLADRQFHRPSEMSGGQRQRVALARAIVSEPKCILADEPTGSLDHESAEQLFQMIVELNEELGISFVFVTHDETLAYRMKRVFRLLDGRLERAF